MNTTSINFTIFFSESWNTEYISIDTSLYTSVIISDKLWPQPRELTKEVRKPRHDLFIHAISETSANWTVDIGYWLLPTYTVLGLTAPALALSAGFPCRLPLLPLSWATMPVPVTKLSAGSHWRLLLLPLAPNTITKTIVFGVDIVGESTRGREVNVLWDMVPYN